MAAPRAVFTIARVAEMLGEDEERLWDVSMEMDPETRRLAVYGTHGEETIAFTQFGIENLAEIAAIYKGNPVLMAQSQKRDRREPPVEHDP